MLGVLADSWEEAPAAFALAVFTVGDGHLGLVAVASDDREVTDDEKLRQGLDVFTDGCDRMAFRQGDFDVGFEIAADGFRLSGFFDFLLDAAAQIEEGSDFGLQILIMQVNFQFLMKF